MFKDVFCVDDLRVLIAKSENSPPTLEASVLEEVFCILCSKYKIPGGRKPENSNLWIKFNKLLYCGGGVSAAMLLLPPNTKLIMTSNPEGQSTVVTDTGDDPSLRNYRSTANTLPLAIAAVAMKIHQGIQYDRRRQEERERAQRSELTEPA
jgi:hypothetical protein